MSNSASLASSSSPLVIPMDPRLRQLLKASFEGDVSLCINLIDANPDILLSTTPYKNNCLHIAAMLGHHEFAREAWSRAPSLLSGTNIDGETPLIAALMAANLSLASDIITVATQFMQHDNLEEGRPLNCMLLKVDRRNENALHHAMRNGFENLALQLLEIEPRLSEQVTNTGESPMYMAARRGYSRVIEQLLQIPSSANSRPNKETPLPAAVRLEQAGYSEVVQQLQEIPSSAVFGPNNESAMHAAVKFDHPVLESPESTFARSLTSSTIDPLLKPWSEPILPWLQKVLEPLWLINQANNDGFLPLHTAARKCDPELLRSLLTHEGQDYNAVNVFGGHALDIVYAKTALWKTLKWNESFTLLSNVIPSSWNYQIRENAKKTIKQQAIKEVKSLTQNYTSNTSLVAALLATINFAAAFTLPGGFSSDSSDAGQPLFARKAAFQMFLISDTIAMCSSLAVAFLCILATWEDLDFLLNYRKTTRALMWCAYGATAIAFGTGLFTVIAPKNLWLAILILVLCTILPLLSKIIGEWPLLMLRYRLRGLFRKDLVPNI
ncbi:uncharacterized protein LOC144546225 [Carex rostrata]